MSTQCRPCCPICYPTWLLQRIDNPLSKERSLCRGRRPKCTFLPSSATGWTDPSRPAHQQMCASLVAKVQSVAGAHVMRSWRPETAGGAQNPSIRGSVSPYLGLQAASAAARGAASRRTGPAGHQHSLAPAMRAAAQRRAPTAGASKQALRSGCQPWARRHRPNSGWSLLNAAPSSGQPLVQFLRVQAACNVWTAASPGTLVARPASTPRATA